MKKFLILIIFFSSSNILSMSIREIISSMGIEKTSDDKSVTSLSLTINNKLKNRLLKVYLGYLDRNTPEAEPLSEVTFQTSFIKDYGFFLLSGLDKQASFWVFKETKKYIALLFDKNNALISNISWNHSSAESPEYSFIIEVNDDKLLLRSLNQSPDAPQ